MRLAAGERDSRSLKAYADAYGRKQRMLELRQKLTVAQAEANQAIAAKSAFLSGLNHELRTPLNAITGFTGLVREQPFLSDEKRAEYLDHVLSSAGVLLERIDAILRAASGADPAPLPEGPETELLPVLKDVLAARTRSIFVSRADIADMLPSLAVAPADLEEALSLVLDTITGDAPTRRAVSCAAKPERGDLPGITMTFEVVDRNEAPNAAALAALAEETRRLGCELTTDEDGRLHLFCPAVRQDRAA
jgi:signal transduction histidine kinase